MAVPLAIKILWNDQAAEAVLGINQLEIIGDVTSSAKAVNCEFIRDIFNYQEAAQRASLHRTAAGNNTMLDIASDSG